MRTTVNIPDNLLQKAKTLSARENRTMGSVIADGLRVILFQTKPTAVKEAPPLATYKGRGIQPGVDLDDNASVLERMNSR